MVKAVCIRVRHVVLSAENLCHDPAGFDTGEAFIQLLVREDQTAVIDARLVQHCCVKVTNVDGVFCHIVTKIVRKRLAFPKLTNVAGQSTFTPCE